MQLMKTLVCLTSYFSDTQFSDECIGSVLEASLIWEPNMIIRVLDRGSKALFWREQGR